DYDIIQDGINASMDGDTVLVAPGDYHQFVRFLGKSILLTSEEGPDLTKICGVVFSEGTDTTATLRGFGISFVGSQALVFIHQGNSGKVLGNTISGNYVYEYGGGITVRGDKVLIKGNIIFNNTAACYGGGMLVSGSGYTIAENIIAGNTANGDFHAPGGGGMYVSGSDLIIEYNLIADNLSGGGYNGGGGILFNTRHEQGTTFIRNNTFVENSCPAFYENNGSGLWVSIIRDSVEIINNIFAYNNEGGISIVRGNMYSSNYNLYWENRYGDYANIEPGPNSLFENPLFVNPDSGDYSLLEDSPCIDAGDPNSPLDPDSTRADIGCYYYHHIVDVTEPDSSNSPHKFYLEQNYPNPFNGQTIISYSLPKDSDVELNIINMRGELVAKPINSHQSAGNHSLIWQGTLNDGTPVATGIYFYELKVSNLHTSPSREVKAMILLK
ncbi:MAG: T9SS type A sorting domain-containing protein, partial [candidate division Zixibacteria bacterium]|nr:T9SS type A sorting domain-containing protein [candidate division Zixibacteria bacterium]